MANRYYTLMIIPEKTSKVRRLLIPSWIVRGSVVLLAFAGILGLIMMLDYGYVMNQIGENRELKIENRRLRQQVQIFSNKMKNVENTMDRIQTFATRLKVITNIEDRDDLVKRLNDPLPDATSNTGAYSRGEPARATPADEPSAAGTGAQAAPAFDERDPEVAQLRVDRDALADQFQGLDHESLLLEQNLEDLYELLADQRAFLAALPTRRPSDGYFTSGFGVRNSPTFGDRVKMHEGLDIANRPGTAIFSTANGIVKFAGVKAGYGQTVQIDHGYGLETWYGHASRLYVKRGDKVYRGDKIAAIGNSGRSTGPHVHYEVRVYNIAVDPLSYILEN
ncbi:MAG: M23 family metallopeptidase [Bdellovibrionales bacterium]|nr:M23 family metallopeptidase [Bdellovibrionales bacterium]